MANNLEELRTENAALAAQVEADVRAALAAENASAAADATEAERNRISGIDEIACLYDDETVRDAKYGHPCTAQEMAFRAAQHAARSGSAFMANAMADAAGEGGANGVNAADAVPDAGAPKTDAQKQADADATVHKLLHGEEA